MHNGHRANVEFTAYNKKWNTNQEIADILQAAEFNDDWLSQQLPEHPLSGSQFLFARSQLVDGNWFKADRYEWKRRKEGKLVREDQMNLKINKENVITAKYAHSAFVPSFHRRAYFLTKKPEFILVHYLNTVANDATPDRLVSDIVSSVRSSGIKCTTSQLVPELSRIFFRALKPEEISALCSNVVQTLAQETTVPNDNIQTSNELSTWSNMSLERRNSCSSACRKGLSSVALRRQPSAFSDSVDTNYLGVVSNCVPELCMPGPSTDGSGAYRNPDDRSHSGETQRSSNLDEETSIYRQQSMSARSLSAGANSIMSVHDSQPSTSRSNPFELSISTASTKGGTKLLVVGNFYMKGHDYSIQFGERKVRARLLQAGVLTLVVPPVEEDCVVQLRVLCDGKVITPSVPFTFRGVDSDDARTNTLQALCDRLHLISVAFGASPSTSNASWQSACVSETSVVSFLQSLQSRRRLPHSDVLVPHPSFPSRTLLHLAALLDFSAVVEYTLNWRKFLPYTREFDPLSRDCEGCTALHLAAKLGHEKVARILLASCSELADVVNDRGRTASDLSCNEELTRITSSANNKETASNNSTRSQLPKNVENDAVVNKTALWVFSKGETLTNERLLSEMQQHTPPMETSSSEHSYDESAMDQCCDDAVRLEISMDTDVHVPDSPKMADLFNEVTTEGVVNEDARGKIASLATRIIAALPERIKTDNPSTSLMEDDVFGADAFAFQHSNPLLASGSMEAHHDFGDVFADFVANPFQMSATTSTNDSSIQPRMAKNYVNGYYHDNGQQAMNNALNNYSNQQNYSNPQTQFAAITRTTPFESRSIDGGTDLDEFFGGCVDVDVDPIQKKLEKIKMSDNEQREVFEAAMVIQRAYREYRARTTDRRQAQIERQAAATIQQCYRRYKQFCYVKKLHSAAIVVQKHFRLKRMNQKEQQECSSSSLPEHPTLHESSIRIQVPQGSSSLLREHLAATTIQHAYRGHRKRQAAARKIQKFMKESRIKLRRMQEVSNDVVSCATPTANSHSESRCNNEKLPSSTFVTDAAIQGR